MKKVMLLVLTVMLISAFLMASGPRLRIVTLTVINKSGNEVMMKLEGSDIGKQFYYLTIPAGDKEWPTVKVFTVLEDVYQRTTWYGEGENAICTGLSSSGVLVMDRNNRLTFTPCYNVPKRTEKVWVPGTECDRNGGIIEQGGGGGRHCRPTPGYYVSGVTTNNGEPSQEKVAYIEYMNLHYGVGKNINHAFADVGDDWSELRSGQLWVIWGVGEIEVPDLVQWRYGY